MWLTGSAVAQVGDPYSRIRSCDKLNVLVISVTVNVVARDVTKMKPLFCDVGGGGCCYLYTAASLLNRRNI